MRGDMIKPESGTIHLTGIAYCAIFLKDYNAGLIWKTMKGVGLSSTKIDPFNVEW